MANTLPNAAQCCFDACEDPVLVAVPGAPAQDGDDGDDGADGQSAFTTLGAGFTMPAELATAIATVANSDWVSLNSILVISGSYFQVTNIPDATHITLKNLEDASTDAYLSNAPAGTVFAFGVKICAGGLQGPSGAGAAGGLLAANNLSDVASAATSRANLGISALLPSSGAGAPTGATTGLLYIDTTGDGTNADLWANVSTVWKKVLQIPN